MKLQLALDRPHHIAILTGVAEWFDYIEVGTSMLKRFGLASLATVREIVPDKVIVADSKTADGAEAEAWMLFQAGADLITVLSNAGPATIDAACRSAERAGKGVIVDTILEPAFDPRRIAAFPPSVRHVLVHVPTDARLAAERTPAESIAGAMRLLSNSENASVMVAGGARAEEARAASAAGVDGLVVGRAVTEADDPSEAARAIRDAAL